MLNPFPLNTPKVFDRIFKERDSAVSGVPLISSLQDLSVHKTCLKRGHTAVQDQMSTAAHHLQPVKNTFAISRLNPYQDQKCFLPQL